MKKLDAAYAEGLRGGPLPSHILRGTPEYAEWRRGALAHSAALLGSIGGKAGTGKSKVRGNSAYYKALRAKPRKVKR